MKSVPLTLDRQRTVTITASKGWFDLGLRDAWRYRDLVWLLARRDFVVAYKQTLLGPLWAVIQPALTCAVFFLVFTKVAKVSTGDLHPIAFYLSGLALWSYFSACFVRTSNVFVANAGMFSKVYFPRVVIPIAVVIGNLISLFFQLLTLGVAILVLVMQNPGFRLFGGGIIALPFLILCLAVLGAGLGMVFSSLSAKYRDVSFVTVFLVQLWMYITPIFYPTSRVPENLRPLFLMNPLAPIIDAFRYEAFGVGFVSWPSLLVALGVSCLFFVGGLVLFCRTEKDFLDEV